MEELTINDEHYTLLAKRKNQQKRTKKSIGDGLDALFDGCSIEGIDNDGDESGKQEPLSDAFTSLNQHQEANEDFVPYYLPPSSESVHEYMNSREMTKVQEKWNALTVLLSPIYCFYYFSSGSWIVVDDALISERMYNYADELSCLKTKQFLPPPPILFAGLGIIVHFPFSFVYHWKYAVELPPGLQRISHWSRRLDHCFIHFITTCYAFSSSGSWIYFLLCSIFNAYCGLSHFRKRINPSKNQIMLAVSLLLCVLPLLIRGENEAFLKVVTLLIISGWLFIRYPFGGWSHALFHIVVALIPPVMMQSASNLKLSQSVIKMTANC